MSTRGTTVRVARSTAIASFLSRVRVDGRDIVVVVAMGILLRSSVLDGDLLGRRFGSAGELHLEHAVPVVRLRPLGIQALADAHRAHERAEQALLLVAARL